MVTIERNLQSELTELDLQVLQEILNGLNYYSSMAERLSWFNSGFYLKQYYTLFHDFRDFYNEAIANDNKVHLYVLGDFIKSFSSILKEYDKCFQGDYSMFRGFVIDSVITIAMILTELLNEK